MKKRFVGPDVLIGLFCALVLVVVTEFELLGQFGPSGYVEVAAVVLYAGAVWLAVKNSVWNWVVSIAATALYLYLFIEWQLYADAGLQVVYIVFSGVGLWAWLRRDRKPEAPKAGHASAAELVLVAVVVVAMTAATREYLLEINGAAPFWDAALTASSVGALYLLIRKRIETWAVWAVVDIAYIGLFISRELYLSAVLYAVLLLMVIRAFVEWRPLLPVAPRREPA